MATPPQDVHFEQEYAFRNVELFKTETLGTGSYGAVCKAKCDELICAAKLLYPVLFQMQPQAPEPGKEHRQPAFRFELECRFLSRINHPNIVQYLGTYRDPETNAPVLLMELMDESLTHYVKLSPGAIPYHVQVNFCYGMAQALAFLHANGIIHRDLSSNNVLLLAGRVKVTDFGMSKFADIAATRLATMTTCPGTPAFMSPEALNEPPVYTEKLDNFSLGVIMVQVVTRKFPDPSDRFTLRELVDPNFPTLKVQAQVPVPEAERRHAHISLIDPTHPLLPIALDCLKDKEAERPSSQQLCQQLALLKEMSKYEESSQQDQPLSANNDQIAHYRQQIESQRHELATARSQIQQLQERLDKSPTNLTEELELKERKLQTKTEQIRSRDEQLRAKENEAQNLRRQLEDKERSLERTELLRIEASQNYQEQKNDSDVREVKLRQLNRELHSKEEVVTAYQRDLRQTEARVEELQQQILIKESQIQDLQAQIKVEPKHHEEIARHSSTPVGTPSNTPHIERKATALWGNLPAAPAFLKAGSTAVCGHDAYFRSAGSKSVYKFDALAKHWKIIADHPFYGFTLVFIEQTLTAVGGFDKEESSNKIYSLVDKKWVEQLPEMPTKRDRPTAVYASGHLIVAGGCDDQTEPLKSINILNVKEKQWYKTASLPFPKYHASATVCEGDLYFTSGDGMPQDKEYSILSCSLSALLQSQRVLSIGARLKKAFKTQSSGMWRSVADLPVRQSYLANVEDQLLAIGGIDHSGQPTKQIFHYNEWSNSWETKMEMRVARSSSMAAVFMENKLLVVGGHNIPTKDVESITV